MNKNINIPKTVDKEYDFFTGVHTPSRKVQLTGPEIKTIDNTKQSKVLHSLKEAIEKSGLRDGMTISFHHHFREGDYVANMVLQELREQGFKNLTLAPSSISNTMNEEVIRCIKEGTITQIITSGMRGALGDFISHGGMDRPVILRSHGNRPRAIASGETHIDVAFLGAPSSDEYGNANGVKGNSICGSLGYAQIDAEYADCTVIITDHLVPYPNTPASIQQTQVDYVVEVESIGNPDNIGKGATRFTKDPKELKIAQMVAEVITKSPYFKDGFSFQTGTGGAALAVTRYLKEEMQKNNIQASFALGGMTTPLVDLLEEGMIQHLLDVQDFDKGAAEGMARNGEQMEIDANFYAGACNRGSGVNQLDIAILSALEIDTQFNVNDMTGSDGALRGAVGGHQDAATAKLTIITAPLVRGRIPTVVKQVATCITPGDNVDILATEIGVAINPKRQDLIKIFSSQNAIPVYTIEELQQRAEKMVGIPDPIAYTDRVVALVEYRDGSLLDAVYELKE